MSSFPSSTWLAADYHLPATYSYRIPMSSMTSAPTLPTPGPATVRLALLRCSLELFGHAITREELFPMLRTMEVRIRPPEAVAISPQRLRAFKWSKEQQTKQPRMRESLMLREMAHAQGMLTVYVQIPATEALRFQALCQALGYWGQTDSLAFCVAIQQRDPPEGECVLPFRECARADRLHPYFSGLATESRDQSLSWEEVTVATGGRGQM